MADVQPFRAIRYDAAVLTGDLSSRLAPPYDVLDQADKDRLLAGSGRNIIKIDMPHFPPGYEGPAQSYADAARTLDAWLSDHTFIEEASPALYIYFQDFTHHGRSYTRKKFFAAVRLQPFEDRVVLPHEHTFGGPKADRLALMKATSCSLSPVFGLYQDSEGLIQEILDRETQRPADAHGALEGVRNRLWVMTDRRVMDVIRSALSDKRLYIADGHHRYGTALNYRDGLIAERGGDLPEDHPARFGLFVLASMDDPGCLVLPTHRVFTDPIVTGRFLVRAWAEGCEPCDGASADIMVLDGRDGREQPLTFTRREVLRELEPDLSDAWRRLDLSYLHRYLIDELLKTAQFEGKAPAITYAKSEEQARKWAVDGPATAVFVKATQMEELRAVCEAGEYMPHKSTYFYPKLATGLCIKRLSS